MAIYRGAIPPLAAVQQNQPQQQSPSSAVCPLLAALWGSGHHFLAIQDPKTSAFQTIPVANAEVATRLAREYAAKGKNVFHACSTYTTSGKRTADNVSLVKSFWLDVDCGKTKADAGQGYLTQKEAADAVHEFCSKAGLPSPGFLINSGNGLHVYWVMDKSIGAKLWKDIASKLKELTKVLGLIADPARTSDMASLMRTPGTMNLKGKDPLPVEYLHISPEPIAVQQLLDAISVAHEKFCKVKELTPVLNKVAGAFSEPFSEDEFDRLVSALRVLDPDCEEYVWKFNRLVVLANLARRLPVWADRLYQLARDWSSGKLWSKPSRAWSTPGKTTKRTGEEVFDETWQRFIKAECSEKPVTVGTIYADAQKAGWRYPTRAPRVASPSPDEFQREPYTHMGEVIPAGRMTPLASIQERYCLVRMDARFWIFDRQNLDARNAEGLALKPEFFNQKEGLLLVLRALWALGVDDNDAGARSREFTKSPQTVCYDGIDFDPKGRGNNKLNLWVGPTLVPQQGGWVLIRAFLLEIICNNDQVAYEYLIAYLAHALQFPEEKPGIMVILIGGQGIGKGTLAKILRLIWSATYWHIHKIEDVTGSFNASLERAFIIFMDEALFVGDRRSSDSLKSLVTETVIQINEKYQPARQTKSFHRFFAATNAEHFKNTEKDDRRDFVLKVSEVRKGDHAYWSALNAEIENGGVAAMMHDLLAMDLSGFNVRAKPNTAALVEQKIHSLGPIERWWFNALMAGDMETSEHSEWLDFIATKAVIDKAVELHGGRLHRKPSDVEAVATLKKLCPSATKGQKQEALGRHRGLHLPDLQTARQEFEQYIGGAVAWEPIEG